jgi:hypothetical protein
MWRNLSLWLSSFVDDLKVSLVINSRSDFVLLETDIDCIHTNGIRQILWHVTLEKLELFHLPGKRTF